MRVRERTAGVWVAALLALAACGTTAAPADPGVAVAPDAGKAVAADTPAAKSRGALACDAPEHDWGSTLEGADVAHTFVVKNVGDGVLRILNARGG